MAGNTYQITPFIHVADLEAALRFFTGTLDFTIPFRQANYAYIEREGAAIRILEASAPKSWVHLMAVSLTTSMSATSARCSMNLGRSWPNCRPAMFMDRWSSRTASAN